MLGSTAFEGPQGPVELAARKRRSILAALALEPGATMTPDRLVDLVWGGDAPPGAHGTMHTYISGLRRSLEPDLAPRARPTVLVTTDAGYRLAVDRTDVDAAWFAAEVRRLHRALSPLTTQLTTGPDPAWPSRDEVVTHVEALEEALRAWRGTAYADLPDHPDVLAERAALDELRATAEEDSALGLLALGEHADVVAATEQATARSTLRERPWALHALALARSGRQAEALEAIRTVRGLLADELGLDPGPELRGLESAILRQDPVLSTWLRPVAPATSDPVVPDAVPPGAAVGPEPRAAGGTPTAPPSPGSLVPGAAATRGPAAVHTSWATVGREGEQAALAGVLDRAVAGTPSFAELVGEPGIGKTRLVDDLVAMAGDRDVAAVVGRCSQDDGAPPLWPWLALLDGLAGDAADGPDATPGRAAVTEARAVLRPADDDADSAERAFAVRESLAGAVRRRALEGPVLLVVEDLHWADTLTLRALTHLVATAASGERLAVVVTRRPWPRPSGALADLGVALARHGGVHLEPAGLSAAEAHRLVADVVDLGLPTAVGDAGLLDGSLAARTGGNPFFLVELARFAGTRGASGGELPASVQQVVARRLDDLPATTRELLLVSAALGRAHAPLLLSVVTGEDASAIDEGLEPAHAVGLVRHRDDGMLAFDHALTRDAVLAAEPVSRVARVHAQIARALESSAPGVDRSAGARVRPRPALAGRRSGARPAGVAVRGDGGRPRPPLVRRRRGHRPPACGRGGPPARPGGHPRGALRAASRARGGRLALGPVAQRRRQRRRGRGAGPRGRRPRAGGPGGLRADPPQRVAAAGDGRGARRPRRRRAVGARRRGGARLPDPVRAHDRARLPALLPAGGRARDRRPRRRGLGHGAAARRPRAAGLGRAHGVPRAVALAPARHAPASSPRRRSRRGASATTRSRSRSG